MNFLEKLNFLMEQNNLNKSSLSKACDIPYTTIDGWYKKGYRGLKLTTLTKLSNFFGTSLDFWVDSTLQNNKDTQINKCLLISNLDEIDLINDFRNLNPRTQGYYLGMIKGASVFEQIANKRGETLDFPPSSNVKENFEENLVNLLDGLDSEHQEALLDALKVKMCRILGVSSLDDYKKENRAKN